MLQGISMVNMSTTRSRVSPPPMGRKERISSPPLESENTRKNKMSRRKGGKRSQFFGSYLTGNT